MNREDHDESHMVSSGSTTGTSQETHESRTTRSELVISPSPGTDQDTSLPVDEPTALSEGTLLTTDSSVCESAGDDSLAFSLDTIPEGMTARQWKIELRKKRREIRKEQAMYDQLL